MKPQGGSEILFKNLIKYIGKDWEPQINLILSACNRQVLDPNRINVVWQHLMCDQMAMIGMVDPVFTQAVEHFVYVSQWQLDQYQIRCPVEPEKNHVIRNAIEPIEFKSKPADKIRLIYTSMPNRGLHVLLDAFRILNRKDIELYVYSSDIIYGKGYSNQVSPNHAHLFHRCKTTPGIVYKGYAMNQAVRQALQKSHILAYPSTYEETSCLAAIEAGAAGCRIVTTNLGALPETCDRWATYVDYQYGDDLNSLAEKYAETLNTEIDSYSQISYTLEDQSRWFNDRYSWENRAHEWNNFIDNICAK